MINILKSRFDGLFCRFCVFKVLNRVLAYFQEIDFLIGITSRFTEGESYLNCVVMDQAPLTVRTTVLFSLEFRQLGPIRGGEMTDVLLLALTSPVIEIFKQLLAESVVLPQCDSNVALGRATKRVYK